MSDYLRDGAAIYRQSFATIRAESDLAAFPADLEPVVVRMIHASGQTDLTRDVVATPGVVSAARHGRGRASAANHAPSAACSAVWSSVTPSDREDAPRRRRRRRAS